MKHFQLGLRAQLGLESIHMEYSKQPWLSDYSGLCLLGWRRELVATTEGWLLERQICQRGVQEPQEYHWKRYVHGPRLGRKRNQEVWLSKKEKLRNQEAQWGWKAKSWKRTQNVTGVCAKSDHLILISMIQTLSILLLLLYVCPSKKWYAQIEGNKTLSCASLLATLNNLTRSIQRGWRRRKGRMIKDCN